MTSSSPIQSDIERYREAIRLAYGRDYGDKLRVEHVHRDIVAITFPKGGRVLVRHDRLQTLTQYLHSKVASATKH